MQHTGRDKSFVYDLTIEPGTVRVRVASVPRSTEVQPGFVRFDTFHYLSPTPYHIFYLYYCYSSFVDSTFSHPPDFVHAPDSTFLHLPDSAFFESSHSPFFPSHPLCESHSSSSILTFITFILSRTRTHILSTHSYVCLYCPAYLP